MNILQILFSNFGKHPRTRKPDTTVPFPVDFRGQLSHNAANCTLCGTCVYVCSPAAIHIDREDVNGTWTYNGGRCTFCGRCVEYCPTDALSFLKQSAPTVNHPSQEITDHAVEYHRCSRCGAVIMPMPFDTLVRIYHSEEAAKNAREIHELCERCRNRVQSQTLKSTVTGTKE